MLCKLAKLCIDPETPELLLGKLRAWDVVIVLQEVLGGLEKYAWKWVLPSPCSRTLDVLLYSPDLLVTAQILLSAWGLGERERWIF